MWSSSGASALLGSTPPLLSLSSDKAICSRALIGGKPWPNVAQLLMSSNTLASLG